MTQPPKTLAVGILTAQREKALKQCLEHLAAGSRKPDLVVVLNNEPDCPVEVVIEPFNQLFPVMLLQGNRLEFAAARNRIVASCNADCIAFLDDDCLADELFLEMVFESLQDHDAVGGLVLSAEPMRSPTDWSPELNWLLGLSTPGVFFDQSGEITVPSTSNMAFRRCVWEAVPFQELGGQIESHQLKNYTLGGEDAQFWRSVRNAGFRTINNPACLVFHCISETRFQVSASLKRAQLDGVSSWKRSGSATSRTYAARNVVETTAALLTTAISRSPTKRRTVRQLKTWRARQWAHLEASGKSAKTDGMPSNSSLLAASAYQVGSGIAKSAFRKSVVAVRNQFFSAEEFDPNPQEERTVAFLCSSFLGDTLIFLPLLHQIARKRPRWKFEVYVSENLRFLFREFKASQFKLVSIQYKPSLLAGLTAIPTVTPSLYSHRIDALFILNYHRLNPLPFYLNPKIPVYNWRVTEGFFPQVWKDLAKRQIERSFEDPEQTSLRRLLAPLQVPLQNAQLSIKVNQTARDRVSKYLSAKGLRTSGFVVVLLDGRADEFKAWPLEYYKEFAHAFYEKSGLPIVFEGRRVGRSCFEMLDLDEVPAFTSAHGLFQLEELAALLEQAAMVVGIDSGPIHLAQAVGTKSLALFGCTDERRWGAENKIKHRTLRAKTAPFSWTLREARLAFSENEHMRRLKPEIVVQAALELLES